MSRQLIAGNWKMNGLTADARSLAQALQSGASNGFGHADLLVCPPFTQISTVAGILTGTAIEVGGQDCHMQAKGAHTGDISAPMLRDLGATHVILGHSERRQNHKEIDETVREKVLAAQSAGLIPIVCFGETEDQRSADGHEDVVGWQIKGSLPDGFADGEGVVAYEPVWAIGTGRTATEQDVAAMHAFIRAELVRQFGDAGRKTRILYGGSVNAKNAAGLLAVADVGGALVGGASLNAQDFFAIAAAASRG